MTKKLEIEMLYGQMGYAMPVAQVAGANTFVVQTGEWAPGIWAGSENMPIEIRNSSGVLTASVSVVSINMDTRTVTVSSALPALLATDVVWHKGAYGNEFPGIHKILTNTGVIFNIDAGVYNLFKGNEYSAGSAALSFTKLNQAAARAVEKGLDSKLLAFVNPRGWANMLNDQAALRKYDSSYSTSKAENGSKSILFHSQNGEIEIEPSIYVKEAYAYLLALEDWMRIGSQDVSFKRPGMEGEFFRDLTDAAGYELRLYSDQAVFCSAPGKNVLIKDIVNSN